MSVYLIADSASDLTQAEAQRLGVCLLPLTVRFGQTEYQDGVTLSGSKFYTMLAECETLPTTSQVTPWQYTQALARMAPQDEAVILTISSRLSGTMQSALAAAAGYGGRVRVVDTLSVTLGERVLVEYAVRLRDAGYTAAALERELLARREQVCVLGVVDTLDYLRRGGRISRTAALAGGLLNVKPVLTVQNGEIVMLGKARGLRASNNLLNQTAAARGGIHFGMPCAAGYSGLEDTALQEYLRQSAGLWQGHIDRVPTCRLGSTIGTHVGPGAVAVAFFCPAQGPAPQTP